MDIGDCMFGYYWFCVCGI